MNPHGPVVRWSTDARRAGRTYLPINGPRWAVLEFKMTMHLPHLPPHATLGCAFAALACTGVIFGGLFGLFGERAQRQPWLAATPAAQQLAAACEAHADRRLRADCLTQVATVLRERDMRGTQLARQ
jgi:hypothetical protein